MGEELVVKTPGKLMIAGEFAVLEPNQKALVTAVNRFVYTTIETAQENKVSLPDFSLHALLWKWENEQINFTTKDKRIDFVANAMETVLGYLKEKQIDLEPVHLIVKSELADENGIKYGLGSSAAVVVSVVEAILTRFISKVPQRSLVFKLAAIAHVKTQGSGSGADIAASVYGGLLSYASFQAEWLLEQLKTVKNVTTLVEKDWTFLSIEPLPKPDFVQFFVAWTGVAASTKELVGRMLQMKVADAKAYADFITKSKTAVEEMTTGIQNKDQQLLFSGVTKNRYALKTFGDAANVPLETKLLSALSECVNVVEGAGKLSGAGGGDCGIAFIPLKQEISQLKDCWCDKGIKPLDLEMYEHPR